METYIFIYCTLYFVDFIYLIKATHEHTFKVSYDALFTSKLSVILYGDHTKISKTKSKGKKEMHSLHVHDIVATNALTIQAQLHIYKVPHWQQM